MGRARGVYVHHCYEPAALDNFCADYGRGGTILRHLGFNDWSLIHEFYSDLYNNGAAIGMGVRERGTGYFLIY